MPIVNLSADFCRKAICPEGKNKIDYRDTNHKRLHPGVSVHQAAKPMPSATGTNTTASANTRLATMET